MSNRESPSPNASRKRPRSRDEGPPDSTDMSSSSASAPNTSAPLANTASRRQPIASDSPNIVSQGQKLLHTPTGYMWERDEDAPGYSWKTKKAVEEYSRAMEQITDKDLIIGNKYGDIGLEDVNQAL